SVAPLRPPDAEHGARYADAEPDDCGRGVLVPAPGQRSGGADARLRRPDVRQLHAVTTDTREACPSRAHPVLAASLEGPPIYRDQRALQHGDRFEANVWLPWDLASAGAMPRTWPDRCSIRCTRNRVLRIARGTAAPTTKGRAVSHRSLLSVPLLLLA